MSNIPLSSNNRTYNINFSKLQDQHQLEFVITFCRNPLMFISSPDKKIVTYNSKIYYHYCYLFWLTIHIHNLFIHNMSLSNILMTCLFRSKIRMEIFSKTGKKFISQQTCKEPYIYDVHMEVGCPHGMRGYKFCHVSVDGVGGHKIGHFLWLSKIYDP